MGVGPIQMVVIGFPDIERLEGRVAAELASLSDIGLIRIVNAVFVARDGDEVVALQVSDLSDEQREELGAAIGAVIGLVAGGEEGAMAGADAGAAAASGPGLAGELAAEILADLPDGSGALVLVVEHRWLIPLADAVRDAGGLVLARRSLGLEELVALGLAVSTGD
jgi:uncharacterized membrane protein